MNLKIFIHIGLLSFIALPLLNSCSDLKRSVDAALSIRKDIDSANQIIKQFEKEEFDRKNPLKSDYDSIINNPKVYASIIPKTLQLQKNSEVIRLSLDSVIRGFKLYSEQIDSSDSIDFNTSVSNSYFIKSGNSIKVKNALKAYYNLLSEIAPVECKSIINHDLIEIERGDFIKSSFEDVPYLAVITILNKYQNDIKDEEKAVLNALKKDALLK